MRGKKNKAKLVGGELLSAQPARCLDSLPVSCNYKQENSQPQKAGVEASNQPLEVASAARLAVGMGGTFFSLICRLFEA